MKIILSALATFGFDLRKTLAAIRGLPPFLRDYQEFKVLAKNDSSFRFGQIKPCLSDRYMTSGVATGHYFIQDITVAQRIFALNPAIHFDVGSRVDGFVAHIASFRKLKVIDIRPLKTTISNIEFTQCDLMEKTPSSLVGAADSLSCLHALEHFGLGRYGDPINPKGYILGFENMKQIVKPGGLIYLSIPIGTSRIEFNAHRVFGRDELVSLFQSAIIERFTYINDDNELFNNVEWDSEQALRAFDCNYGCGIFELRIPTTLPKITIESREMGSTT